jgi:hypothetical protein
MEAHSRRLRADPRFQPDFRQLVVGTEIGDLRATREGLTLLARLNPFGAGARRAWVVATDVSFGLARMYELLRGESADTLMIFRDQAAALEWLGAGRGRAGRRRGRAPGGARLAGAAPRRRAAGDRRPVAARDEPGVRRLLDDRGAAAS